MSFIYLIQSIPTWNSNESTKCR